MDSEGHIDGWGGIKESEAFVLNLVPQECRDEYLSEELIMNIFFGKISTKKERAQIDEGYYRAPKKSSWFNGIEPKDYTYIVGGGKIQLWQAEEWAKKEGDDILRFKIIHNNLGINTKQLAAIKYFTLTMELVVLTVRSTAKSKKAFFLIEYDSKYFTEDMLKDINIYEDKDTYRKIHILDSNTKPSVNSIDVQLYKEDNQWHLYRSPFISKEIIDAFKDNTTMLGRGQVNKDKTINIIISPDNLGKKLSSESLSILELYDLFCCDYTEKEIIEPDEERYWVISPGQNAKFWNDFKENNIIAMGGDEIGDLTIYSDKESIREKLVQLYGETSRKNDALAMWEFCNVMKEGDYVFAKKGISEIIGYGKIVSKYIFDESREEYKHVRKVEWNSLGNWIIPKEEDAGIPLKTLTDVTDHHIFIEKMLPLVTSTHPVSPHSDLGYWWLNANPKIWDISKVKIGEKQTYTTHNEKGNKRRIYKHFEVVQPGDVVLGYVSSPDKEITTICRITKGIHTNEEGESIEFEVTEKISNPVSYEELKEIPDLSNCEPLRNNQGSLFKLTKDEYEVIRDLIDEKNIEEKAVEVKPYSTEKALESLFIKQKEFEDILEVLKFKKNIILQGAPGVGKTFIAKRLAYALMQQEAPQRVQLIQFHQSYSYEDFIQGFRPNEKEHFTLKNGVFYDFCKKAQRDPDNKYVFIIDEINRGNLSKIFGELMMLIEPDKRGKDFAVPLTYASAADEKFYIPETLYMIGTMNTADRSLALVDYALRRRFSFISLIPKFNTPEFRVFLESKNIDGNLISKIISKMIALNEKISKDEKNLGIGYQIGHSFFCPNDDGVYDEGWYERVINHEIRPLLEEYWFDDMEGVNQCIKDLLS